MRKLTEDGYIQRYMNFIKNPAPEQKQFANDTFQMLVNDRDTSIITVFPARCGVGKSTAIKAMINYCVKHDNLKYRYKESVGLVIITDQLKRLKEYQCAPKNTEYDYSQIQHESFCTYITSKDETKTAGELLTISQYTPIVLLSTQRYFALSDHQRARLFEYRIGNNKRSTKHSRRIVIFDEKPYFYSTKILEVSNLNDVSTALQKGIPSDDKNKDWIMKEYGSFRSKMANELLIKEKTDKSEDIFYWRDPNSQSVTTNDARFYEIVNSYKNELSKIRQSAFVDLLDFKKLMEEGGFFLTKRKGKGQDYGTWFELFQDNRDKFYLGEGKAKFFVFDASADTDPDYDVDYVKMINCTQYNVSIPLTIRQHDVNTSKSHIVSNQQEDFTINAIKQDMQDRTPDSHSVLVATYMKSKKHFTDRNLKVMHFGNTKGLNCFASILHMAHVGLNRSHHFNYFITWLSKHPVQMELLKHLGEEKSRQYIADFTKQIKGLFESEELNEIMFKSILVDFEQNIFRTAIRDYRNTKKVELHTYWNCDVFSKLNRLIRKRYEPYGVEIQYMGVPQAVAQAKVKNRKPKNGEQTVPQKILEWRDQQEKGKVFKLSEMLNELNIDNNAFKGAVRTNQTIRNIFSTSRTDKQGYYKIA
ncbi:MAG: hypothetical protein FWG31_03605 [Oscillospiraceae bacterium]|nr:hypothetical protein [Oscillospiraceae bacterium]